MPAHVHVVASARLHPIRSRRLMRLLEALRASRVPMGVAYARRGLELGRRSEVPVTEGFETAAQCVRFNMLDDVCRARGLVEEASRMA
jgi:hypothetical protein